MSHETYETVKQSGQVIAAILATVITTVVGTWKLFERKEQQRRRARPHDDRSSDPRPLRRSLDQEPRHEPRVVTRGEWHDLMALLNTVHPGFETMTLRIDNVETDVTEVRRVLDTHIDETRKAFDGVSRLEEQFAAHRQAWSNAGDRAEKDRAEMNAQLSEIRGLLYGTPPPRRA